MWHILKKEKEDIKECFVYPLRFRLCYGEAKETFQAGEWFYSILTRVLKRGGGSSNLLGFLYRKKTPA